MKPIKVYRSIYDTKEDLTLVSKFFVEEGNCWDADYLLEIYQDQEGHFGFFEVIPGGYGTYTYDPVCTGYLYPTTSWQEFYDLGLTDKMREAIGGWEPQAGEDQQ